VIRKSGYRFSEKITLKQNDGRDDLSDKGRHAGVGYGIKWLGVPLGLATLEGACFDQAFASRR
jgi:hypothetical protein